MTCSIITCSCHSM